MDRHGLDFSPHPLTVLFSAFLGQLRGKPVHTSPSQTFLCLQVKRARLLPHPESPHYNPGNLTRGFFCRFSSLCSELKSSAAVFTSRRFRLALLHTECVSGLSLKLGSPRNLTVVKALEKAFGPLPARKVQPDAIKFCFFHPYL